MSEEVKRTGSMIEDSNIKKQEIDTNFGKVIAYIQGNNINIQHKLYIHSNMCLRNRISQSRFIFTFINFVNE